MHDVRPLHSTFSTTTVPTVTLPVPVFPFDLPEARRGIGVLRSLQRREGSGANTLTTMMPRVHSTTPTHDSTALHTEKKNTDKWLRHVSTSPVNHHDHRHAVSSLQEQRHHQHRLCGCAVKHSPWEQAFQVILESQPSP